MIFVFTGRTNCNESLFIYREGFNCTYYQHPEFEPLFLDDFPNDQRKQAESVCGGSGDKTCIFDFLATKNDAVAQNTKQIEIVAKKDQLDASMYNCFIWHCHFTFFKVLRKNTGWKSYTIYINIPEFEHSNGYHSEISVNSLYLLSILRSLYCPRISGIDSNT